MLLGTSLLRALLCFILLDLHLDSRSLGLSSSSISHTYQVQLAHIYSHIYNFSRPDLTYRDTPLLSTYPSRLPGSYTVYLNRSIMPTNIFLDLFVSSLRIFTRVLGISIRSWNFSINQPTSSFRIFTHVLQNILHSIVAYARNSVSL